MHVLDRAKVAWEAYKVTMRNHPRRQLRKRDFVAGYQQGVLEEAERTQAHVVPANLNLYKLLRSLEESPELADTLRAEIPESVKRLVTFLETSELPKVGK